MKLTENFYNKVSAELKNTYFTEVVHGATENKKYYKFKYALECFSNGVISYSRLIKKLSKNCQDDKTNIETILNKFITFKN